MHEIASAVTQATQIDQDLIDMLRSTLIKFALVRHEAFDFSSGAQVPGETNTDKSHLVLKIDASALRYIGAWIGEHGAGDDGDDKAWHCHQELLLVTPPDSDHFDAALRDVALHVAVRIAPIVYHHIASLDPASVLASMIALCFVCDGPSALFGTLLFKLRHETTNLTLEESIANETKQLTECICSTSNDKDRKRKHIRRLVQLVLRACLQNQSDFEKFAMYVGE